MFISFSNEFRVQYINYMSIRSFFTSHTAWTDRRIKMNQKYSNYVEKFLKKKCSFHLEKNENIEAIK